MIAYSIRVHGLVQGVFFRKSTREKALEFGINGYVRNCEDGTVEIFVEGDEKLINQFIEWCRKGPKGAKVDKVDIHGQPLKNISGFVITR